MFSFQIISWYFQGAFQLTQYMTRLLSNGLILPYTTAVLSRGFTSLLRVLAAVCVLPPSSLPPCNLLSGALTTGGMSLTGGNTRETNSTFPPSDHSTNKVSLGLGNTKNPRTCLWNNKSIHSWKTRTCLRFGAEPTMQLIFIGLLYVDPKHLIWRAQLIQNS